MARLATVADLESRLGRGLDEDETTRAEALLDSASARVRTYTGQQFDETTGGSRLRVRSGRVRLPQRPVTAVASVADTDANDVAFTWHAGDTVYLDALGTLHRFDLQPYGGSGPQWVDVTYTHGYASTPDDVVEVVCQMVLRAFGSDPAASGLTQESVEGYSYSIGGAAAAGAVGMLDDEKAALDVYRRKGGTIRISP